MRKEILGVQADPTSPERGQYGFLQDLVRHVAYETLSRRERRTRHLAAAEYLSTVFAHEEDEVIEVIASHYLAADEAVPDADDAAETRGKAQGMLVRAGERAESLAAAAEAKRYFEQAAELTAGRPEKADLLARAGDMARRAGDPDAARRLLAQAVDLFEQDGDTHAAALVSSRLARVERFTGRLDEALARLERAFEMIAEDEPDEDMALIAGRLAMAHFTSGDVERAIERSEQAIDLAEAYGSPEALALALGAKAWVAHSRGHMEETLALFKQELAIALEHDLFEDAGSAYFLLSDHSFHRDRYEDALAYLDDALALARRLGNRPNEWSILSERTYALYMLGRWDEALAVMHELTDEQARAGGMYLSLLTGPLEIHLHRGDVVEAQRLVSHFSSLGDSTDVQERVCYFGAAAAIARAESRTRDALDAGLHFEEGLQTHGISHQAVEQGLVEALDAALSLGDRSKAEDLLGQLEAIPPGRRPPFLDAHRHRFRGRLAADPARIEAAAQRFREIGIPFWLAVTLLEQAELTGDEWLLDEAREIFEDLRATPWLERLDAARSKRPDRVPAPS